MSTEYDRMQEARERLERVLAPQSTQEWGIAKWLEKFDLPTIETLAVLVERRVRTSTRATRMAAAQRTLDRWDAQQSAPANEVSAMEYLASGGDPEKLPRPLREWGVSRVHEPHEDPATAVSLAYDRGFAEGIEHARAQQERGIDPELWDDQR